MRKWKCPECGCLSETIETELKGNCELTTEREQEEEYLETGYSNCKICGHQESRWSEKNFEVVEI